MCVIAAVSVVLPWSTWPIVPTFTWGLVRSNLPFAMSYSLLLLIVVFLDDGVRYAPRCFGVVLELHGVGGPALRQRAQRGGVAEHLAQRHLRLDRLAAGQVVHALDHAAAARQIADHVAHLLLGRLDLDRHDRLEQGRSRGAHAVLESEDRGHLERVLVRIDLVVRAVGQGDLRIDHGEAGEHAFLQRLVHALLDRRDELLRHATALDGVDELVALARLRLEREPNVAILAASTRLLDELALGFERLLEGLAVSHLRLADRGFDAELALHAVDDDLEVQLAHA